MPTISEVLASNVDRDEKGFAMFYVLVQKALIWELYPFPELYAQSRISWETYSAEQKKYFIDLAENTPPSEVQAVLDLKKPRETVTWTVGDPVIIPVEEIKLDDEETS